MQRGTIFRHSGSWFLKYYDKHATPTGPKRVRVCVKLCRVDAHHRVKTHVVSLADKVLGPVNSGITVPESFMLVSEFIEKNYLPHVKATLRPSTCKDYCDVFRVHVKARLGAVKLREFRTVHAQRMIQSIDSVGHTSKLRIKSFLSGVFSHCKREGILDGENPVRDVRIVGRTSRQKMPVYSIGEIEMAIYALQEPGRTVFAVAAFSGLRLSELRGLRWGDFDGQALYVRRSVWRTKISPPKTAESEAAVPVLRIVSRALEAHRERCGNPGPDSYIFAGPKRGAPLNLANLARRVIKPAIERQGISWKGWHSLRRGLASNLYALGTPPRVIQSILRHTSMRMTLEYYVQDDIQAARSAVAKLEGAFGGMGDFFFMEPREQSTKWST